MNKMNEGKEVVVNVKPRRSDKKNKGASLVEYALLVALIAVVAIVAIRLLGTTVSEKFSQVQSEIASS